MAKPQKMTITVKPTNKKMTKEELDGYLKAKAMGGGLFKSKKTYNRKEKHKKSLI